MVLLAGDVGGTKTLLGVFRKAGGKLQRVREGSFASQEHASLEQMVQIFLGAEPARITACAVGVAGPIARGKSGIVNLPWQVDERALARALRTPRVRVINDLEANAWGVGQLSARQTASLTPGLRAARGNAALISPGTGLGMAILFWDGVRHRPSASEGGHQAWAPRNPVEVELLEFLLRRHERVSIERVLAGPGFHAIYEFVVESGRETATPLMKSRMEAGDPNAAIARAALAKEDRAAEHALEIYVSAFGAVAGDLALVAGAGAGIYLGGGIVPRILPRLTDGPFLESFRAKGRLRPVVERVPIKAILEPRTALIGAAACAAHLHEERRRRPEQKQR